MNREPDAGWSDESVVAYIGYWAEEWSKCGFDMEKANEINDERSVKSAKLLASRGADVLGKLIPLLED